MGSDASHGISDRLGEGLVLRNLCGRRRKDTGLPDDQWRHLLANERNGKVSGGGAWNIRDEYVRDIGDGSSDSGFLDAGRI